MPRFPTPIKFTPNAADGALALKIRAAAKRHKITASELLRRAVHEWLSRHGEKR